MCVTQDAYDAAKECFLTDTYLKLKRFLIGVIGEKLYVFAEMA